MPPRADVGRLNVGVRVHVAPEDGRRERVGEDPLVPQPLHVWLATARVAQRPILYEEAQPSDHVPQHRRCAATGVGLGSAHVQQAEVYARALGDDDESEAAHRLGVQQCIRVGEKHHVGV